MESMKMETCHMAEHYRERENNSCAWFANSVFNVTICRFKRFFQRLRGLGGFEIQLRV